MHEKITINESLSVIIGFVSNWLKLSLIKNGEEVVWSNYLESDTFLIKAENLSHKGAKIKLGIKNFNKLVSLYTDQEIEELLKIRLNARKMLKNNDPFFKEKEVKKVLEKIKELGVEKEVLEALSVKKVIVKKVSK